MRVIVISIGVVVMVMAVLVIAKIVNTSDGSTSNAVQLRPVDNAGAASIPPTTASTSSAPMVVWAAHTEARFEPCGCSAGMFGGLVRRAGLLKQVPDERALSLELGGWSGGKAEHLLIRSEFYLRALSQVGIDVIGLGSAEVALGAPALQRLLASNTDIPVVCANVRNDNGQLLSRESATITVAGQEFVVTSVVSRSAMGEGLQVQDPVDAVARVMAAAEQKTIVVMADVDEAGLTALASALPTVSLIVGGQVTSPSPQPLSVGAVRIIHVANHGKTIGWWQWGAPACHFELIRDTLPDQSEVRAIVHAYQAHLGSTKLDSDKSTRVGGFVGDAACVSCHVTAAATHVASKHPHAYASLIQRGYETDPDCLRCHVTGMGFSDGFVRLSQPAPGSVRPQHALVSCESCHGPGQAHVAAAGRDQPLRPVSVATCVQCHDQENSPNFDYQRYWQKIAHGK